MRRLRDRGTTTPRQFGLEVPVVAGYEGRPIGCELGLGHTADVTPLIPVVDRLRSRFAVGTVCIAADRGRISQETIEE